MPGSSLWLVPPPTHPVHRALSTLVQSTLPARFPTEAGPASTSGGPQGAVAPHFFAPHMTLTSEVDPSRYGDDPQGWLDSIEPWPSSAAGAAGFPRVRFERVATQDVFFRRCFVRVGFDGVRALAGLARERGVSRSAASDEGGRSTAGAGDGEWGSSRFGEETERWLERWRKEYGPHVSLIYGDVPIKDEVLKEVAKAVREAGIKLSEESPDGTGEGSGWDGWDGGVVWLVPTDKPIAEWKPIATREL